MMLREWEVSMASRGLTDLQRECDTLTARGRVLLGDADAYLDGEMAAFIGTYLYCLGSWACFGEAHQLAPPLSVTFGSVPLMVR